MNIFVLDDFKNDREMLAAPFRAHHEVRCATDLEDARRVLEHWWPDVALVDAIFPKKRNGAPVFAADAFLELLEEKRATYLGMPQIILVSGQNDTAKRFDEVREWLAFGRIADVIPKSTADIGIEFFRSVLQLRVDTLLDRQRWHAIQTSAESASEWFARLGIVTRSPRMLALKVNLLAAAKFPGCVLLIGRTGCGKELFAEAIRTLSRPRKPYKIINCGAIPPHLFEAEMFGVKKLPPSVTYVGKSGLLKEVGDGTLLLDEIQNLDISHQGKVLRVLQERTFSPVGATEEIPFLGKFIVATNENLWEKVEKGLFREDLYFRIAALTISIPDLADRPEDIPELAEHFVGDFVQKQRAQGLVCPDIELDQKCLPILSSFNWRGNVRELQSAVEAAAAFALVKPSGSETRATITPDLLIRSNAKLAAVMPQISPQDAVLARTGIAQRWVDLKEHRSQEIEEAIVTLLTESGEAQFRSLQRSLRPREADDDSDPPGRDSQDPATIHCLKALLYMLLREDHRANIQDLLAVVGLTAWETGKKIITVLAAQYPGVTGYKPFIKVPSPGVRQQAELLNGIAHHYSQDTLLTQERAQYIPQPV